MLVKEFMTKEVVCCTPWDTARTAAYRMMVYGVGAIPVVSDQGDLLLEGIVTDRDLCCGVVASGKNADSALVSEWMTPVPVTCEPEYSVEECEELMRENQVRRIPVVDKRGRCIGIVAQADIALHLPAADVAKTIGDISRPSSQRAPTPGKKYFYCGQLHEQDEILLLNRRRELSKHEVLR